MFEPQIAERDTLIRSFNESNALVVDAVRDEQLELEECGAHVRRCRIEVLSVYGHHRSSDVLQSGGTDRHDR